MRRAISTRGCPALNLINQIGGELAQTGREWTFKLLYRFFVIESFPEADPHYVIFDSDSKFNAAAIALLKSTGLERKHETSGTLAKWVRSSQRGMLDQIIPLNERHLLRLLREYVTYNNEERVHDSLDKDAPDPRTEERRPSPMATVTSSARSRCLYLVMVEGSLRETRLFPPEPRGQLTFGYAYLIPLYNGERRNKQ